MKSISLQIDRTGIAAFFDECIVWLAQTGHRLKQGSAWSGLVLIQTGWRSITVQLVTCEIQVKVAISVVIKERKTDPVAVGFIAMMTGKWLRKASFKKNTDRTFGPVDTTVLYATPSRLTVAMLPAFARSAASRV